MGCPRDFTSRKTFSWACIGCNGCFKEKPFDIMRSLLIRMEGKFNILDVEVVECRDGEQ